MKISCMRIHVQSGSFSNDSVLALAATGGFAYFLMDRLLTKDRLVPTVWN